MKLKFGPAVSSSTFSIKQTENYLEKALGFSNEAIELSFTKVQEVVYSRKIVKLFRQFKYRSIHLPVVKTIDSKKVFLKYPDPTIDPQIEIIDKLITQSDPDTVLVHPDQISDFSWISNKYGSLLAFENMDSNKQFGKTIGDMDIVFSLCPQARWVFDINHIYTNDNTMKLAKPFYDKFENRLTHYHISGFGGFHDALCISKENIILNGLLSFDKPIIDEGDLMSKDILGEEYKYIVEKLEKIRK